MDSSSTSDSNSPQNPLPKPIEYHVVAPAVLFPHSLNSVIVSLLNVSAAYPVLVELHLLRIDPSGAERLLKKKQIITKEGPCEIQLKISDLPLGPYTLRVKGYKAQRVDDPEHEDNTKVEIFTDHARVEVGSSSKKDLILIQTDKSVYKAGQSVKFRVLTLDSKLIPLPNERIDIHIKDGKDNRIKQWNEVSSGEYGVVSQELQLSEEPILGEWSINVEQKDRKVTKTFRVEEYVLPLFDVELKSEPSFITLDKPEFNLTVRGNYTYGKPLDGKVKLTVTPKGPRIADDTKGLEQVHSFKGGSIDIPLNPIRELNLNSLQFHRKNDKHFNLDAVEGKIEIDAEVEDEVSGHKQSRSLTIPVHDRDIKIEMVKLRDTYKPGLKYPVLIKVTSQDDSLIENLESDIHLYSYLGNDLREIVTLKPERGLARVELSTVTDNDNHYYDRPALSLRAQFRHHWYLLGSCQPEYSRSNSYLQLISLTEDRVQVGQPIRVSIALSEKKTGDSCIAKRLVTILILNEHQSIISMETIEIDPVLPFEYTHQTIQNMEPRITMIAYAWHGGVEMVADSLELSIESRLMTTINIQPSVSIAQPSDNINVQVKTSPCAFVGLLAVDQSVLLLGNENDITLKSVKEEVRRNSEKPGSNNKGYGGGCYGPRDRNHFRDAGLIVMLTKPKRDSVSYDGFYEDDSFPRIVPRSMNYQAMSLSSSPALFGASMAARTSSSPNMMMKKKVSMDYVKEDLIEQAPAIQVRKDFPETWIWEAMISDEKGEASLSKTIPDTITSWFIGGFGIDRKSGLGIAESQAKITVFRPFFLKLNLPFSVIRGETISLPVHVFNYQDHDVQATIIFENVNQEFDFMSGDEAEPKERRVKIHVKPNGTATVPFVIKPLKLGQVTLKVTGVTKDAGDSIERKLLVKPEGVPKYHNQQFFIELREPEKTMTDITVPIIMPADRVPDSEIIKSSVIGILLGAALSNIDNLVRMPYGCGEQNMMGFVPNILVIEYLQKTKELTPEIKSKAIEHMESGYQRELTYMHDDGSFSAFGKSDQCGSLWLTAYVVKSFTQATPHINIDKSVLDRSRNYLVERQQSDGSFIDEGRMFERHMTGGSTSSNISMTAFVLIALLQESSSIDSNVIKRTIEYLKNAVKSHLTTYELAIVNYALHLSNLTKQDTIKMAHDSFMSRMKMDKSKAYWVNNNKQEKISSIDIEATSYGLLTLVLKGDIPNAMSVFRWLISQQNSRGGFMSTQDTAIALQALASLAGSLSTDTPNLDICFSSGSESTSSNSIQAHRFKVDATNRLVYQEAKLPSNISSLAVKAAGKGVCIAQVSWQYNMVEQAKEFDPFSLTPKIIKSDPTHVEIHITTSYKKEGESNMAVMEVELPSGFTADSERIKNDSTTKATAKRVEYENSETKINFYFDKLSAEKKDVIVFAMKSYDVDDLKPVPVTLYDYYDPNQKTTVYYDLK